MQACLALLDQASHFGSSAVSHETGDGDPRRAADEYMCAMEAMLQAMDALPSGIDARSRKTILSACRQKMELYYARSQLLLKVAAEEEQTSADIQPPDSNLLAHHQYVLQMYQPLGCPPIMIPPTSFFIQQGPQPAPENSGAAPAEVAATSVSSTRDETSPDPNNKFGNDDESGSNSFDELYKQFLGK